MSTAFAEQHRSANIAGFNAVHPGLQELSVNTIKKYAKTLGSSATPLQTRYMATMAKAGHLDGGAIKRAWNESNNATLPDVHKMLGLEKKSASSGGSSKSRRA